MTAQDVRINYASTPSASASDIYDLSNPETTDDNGTEVRFYSPFRNVRVFNTGSTDLKVFLNNRRGYDYVPSGTIYAVNDDNIDFVKVTNVSGSSAGEYQLVLDSSASELSALQRINERVSL